jgi:hypothetical protein
MGTTTRCECLQLSLQVVGGTSAVAPMWAAWKSLTDGVAGKVLPFSAQVRRCRALQPLDLPHDAQPCL